MILQERVDRRSVELRILSQPTVLPARSAVDRPDPQRAVSRDEEASNEVAGERLSGREFPDCGFDAIEAQQSEFRTEPQITVGGLRDACDIAFGEAVADFPGGVGVLADVERGVQRER